MESLLIVVCALAGIAIGGGLAQLGGTDQLRDVAFMPGSAASPPAAVTVTPTAVIGVALSPAPPTKATTPASSPTVTAVATFVDARSEVRDAIQTVIQQFAQIKAYALRYLDDSQLETVLAGDALDSQRASLEWLRQKNAYWDTRLHELVIDSVTLAGSTRASVSVTKVETGLLYIDGKLNERSSYTRDRYRVAYDLELIGGRWYITRKEAHELAVIETPTGTPTPTRIATAIPRPTCFQPDFKGKTEIDHPLMRIRGYVFNRWGGGMGGVLVRIRAYDWSTEMRTWDNGYYYFDGLANAVEYMLSLPEYPCSGSQRVEMKFGSEARVDFQQEQ